jgi:hypothetical protein
VNHNYRGDVALAPRNPIPTFDATGCRDVGGPLSDSTWLLWIKNRIDEFSANPTLASEPANR